MILGCGTIFNGSSQGIGFSSVPTNATITVDNHTFGHTPTVINLSRKDNHIVKIELEGYETFEATITRKVSGWVWGNLVFGGLIGLAVDAISGGLYKLKPDQVQAQLGEKKLGLQNEGDVIFITVVFEPELEWEKIGVLAKR